MITNYFTLKALVEVWNTRFKGAVVGDVFTQNRDELILALGTPEKDEMLRILTAPTLQGIFSNEGYSRARRNVLTIFEPVIGKSIVKISVADADRFVFLHLNNGWKIQCQLFKPHANVFLVNAKNEIVQAFKLNRNWEGKPAPEPKSAADVSDLATFEMRWHAANGAKTFVHQLRKTVPFLNEFLAEEVLFRTQNTLDLPQLFQECQAIFAEMQKPKPRIYWLEKDGKGAQRYADLFSLIPLQHRETQASQIVEVFDNVEDAVRIYVRKKLAQHDYETAFVPLHKALNHAHLHFSHQTEQMLNELSKPSRADQYEKWAHLLMANLDQLTKGQKETVLNDMFVEGQTQKIILDEKLSPVENAQRFYAKARKTRQAREIAESRWSEIEALASQTGNLLAALEAVKTANEIEKFRTEHQDALLKLVSNQAMGMESRPFRRFLILGHEVWVGRNGKENNELTFKHARKYDLWFHARGVGGSHVILRWHNDPKRKPSPQLLEQVAEIAAHFSQAKTSHLAPVQYTERKFVRKMKNGAPGQVIIEREQVLLVEPKLPS